MLYSLLKIGVRVTARLYFSHIKVTGLDHVPANKPILLLPNHPNSFLDAVLLEAYFKYPVHSLARGDVFNRAFFARLLSAIHILPIYRITEGKENLSKNNSTFDTCAKLIGQNKTVLIFPEGRSIPDHELRIFKKGPPRISARAWKSNSPANELIVIPIGLSYAHFNGAGNTVHIKSGKSYTAQHFNLTQSDAAFVKDFNTILYHDIASLIDIPEEAKSKTPAQQWYFAPLYRLCSYVAPRVVEDYTFHDSIRFGLFLFLWPLYGILVAGISYALLNMILN